MAQTQNSVDCSDLPREREVRAVCQSLRALHGVSRLGNPKDPLDDLIYVLLSNKTRLSTSKIIYDRLRKSFPRWDQLLTRPFQAVERILRPGGLSRKKTIQLRGAIRRIVRDWGACTLSGLASWSTVKAESYLTSLPGVSTKVAKCVLMYALKRRVLPVDSHVHRIARRLGWCSTSRADASHQRLEAVVPPHLRFGFHVACIVHGRTICTVKVPRCEKCSLRRFCDYSQGKGIPQ